jgi:toxin HigB-1
MIRSFKDKDSESLYHLQFVRKFSGFERQAIRRLRILDSAITLQDLAGLPSNRFEALVGNRAGQYSIRINLQWRLCFRWDNVPYDVEIVDYH